MHTNSARARPARSSESQSPLPALELRHVTATPDGVTRSDSERTDWARAPRRPLPSSPLPPPPPAAACAGPPERTYWVRIWVQKFLTHARARTHTHTHTHATRIVKHECGVTRSVARSVTRSRRDSKRDSKRDFQRDSEVRHLERDACLSCRRKGRKKAFRTDGVPGGGADATGLTRSDSDCDSG